MISARKLAPKGKMDDPVRIPRTLLARLMAAIETPDDLRPAERRNLLDDADAYYPYGQLER